MTHLFRYTNDRARLLGLSSSIVIHALFVVSCYLVSFAPVDADPVIWIHVKNVGDLLPPPRIAAGDLGTTVNPVLYERSLGVPVAVPDLEVAPEQTIPTQSELSTTLDQKLLNTGGSGGLEGLGEGPIVINDEEPDPGVFKPVEIEPVPVKVIAPQYPEIARQAGIEGTVWVKILVTKEGKAKKVIVDKSDADIFNEYAIQAALQWVFTPAMMNNGPVAFWASVPFRFVLKK